MSTLVRISDETMAELGVRVDHSARDHDRCFGLYDVRRIRRTLRRIVRLERWRNYNRKAPATFRDGIAHNRWWYLVIKPACRRFGVRA